MTPSRMAVILGVALLGPAAARGAPSPEAPPVRSVEILSPVYTIDRIYKSMKGPESRQSVRLLDDAAAPELLWVTGYEAVMVGEDGTTPRPQEFMCHSNLEIGNAREHERIFGKPEGVQNPRLFTLSQGQLSVRFPAGYGLPVTSSESFRLGTQVLNLNHPEGVPPVRHKIRIDFVRDRDLGKPLVPLVATGANVMVSLEDRPLTWGTADPSEAQEEASCLPGHSASRVPDVDAQGRKFSGHFLVPPGRHVHRTLATDQLAFRYDTTIHYIAVHLHPFAESIELRDLTAGKSLFRSKATGFDDRIGLDRVEDYSSREGIPVFKDHEYEVVAVYDNTTTKIHDAMAVLFVYYRDREFKKPASAAPAGGH